MGIFRVFFSFFKRNVTLDPPGYVAGRYDFVADRLWPHDL